MTYNPQLTRGTNPTFTSGSNDSHPLIPQAVAPACHSLGCNISFVSSAFAVDERLRPVHGPEGTYLVHNPPSGSRSVYFLSDEVLSNPNVPLLREMRPWLDMLHTVDGPHDVLPGDPQLQWQECEYDGRYRKMEGEPS